VKLALLLVIGCGGSQPPPKPPPPSQCGAVADHLISQMSGAAKADPEDVDPVRKALFKHCTDDGWSIELQQCLLSTTDLPDNDRCRSLFTEKQNAQLRN